ncbi:MAG: NUDIX domain-containing protein [Ardenticatenaceae bacterium]
MKLSEWRYCPRCGAPLVLRRKSGGIRPVCHACHFVHFADPKVTVAVLIEREGRVLLGKRAVNPRRGFWCLPGGFVDYGELVREAAAREALEETNLKVTIGELLGVEDWDDEESGKKGIALFFCAEVEEHHAEPVAADDMLELDWFARDQLPPMAFASHEMMIKGTSGT